MASSRSPLLLGLSALLVSANAILSTPGSVERKSSMRCPPSVGDRSAEDVIQQLNLTLDDEKGYYVQTFEDAYAVPCLSNRSASTAIYYLLEGADGESAWHRVDAVEVWHHYAGAPLVLSLSSDDGRPWRNVTLGPDIFDNQRPQVVVQKEEWQRARSLGKWTLVGTTVAPGFVSSELAAPGWAPS